MVSAFVTTMQLTKIIIIVSVVAVLFLSACSVRSTEEEYDVYAAMADMPCHQMPDGSWMGRCDEETPELAIDAQPAKASSVLTPERTLLLDARPVKWDVDGVEVQGYGYNGEVPGTLYQVAKD